MSCSILTVCEAVFPGILRHNPQVGFIASLLICYIGATLLFLNNFYLVITSVSVKDAVTRFYGPLFAYIIPCALEPNPDMWWLFCWMPLFMLFTTELVLRQVFFFSLMLDKQRLIPIVRQSFAIPVQDRSLEIDCSVRGVVLFAALAAEEPRAESDRGVHLGVDQLLPQFGHWSQVFAEAVQRQVSLYRACGEPAKGCLTSFCVVARTSGLEGEHE